MALADTMVSTLVTVLINSGKLSEADIRNRFNEFGEAITQVKALCDELEQSREVLAAIHVWVANTGGFNNVDGRTDQDGGGASSGGGSLRVIGDGS